MASDDNDYTLKDLLLAEVEKLNPEAIILGNKSK